MALLEINWSPSKRDLWQFAGIWVIAFALIGTLFSMPWWFLYAPRLGTAFWIIAPIGLIGLIKPGFMRPIYMLWMYLAFPIGWTISHVMMGAVFYGMMTPIGFIMRLVGYDSMDRGFDTSAKSYWTPHVQAGSPARYFRQF